MANDASTDGEQITMIGRQQFPQETWVIRREDGQELSLRTGASAVCEFTAAPGHRLFIRSIAEQVAAHHGGQVVLIPADRVASLSKMLAPLIGQRPS
jgi:hypothetical protein